MGDLVGVTDREYFGDLDTSCMGLTPLPVAERAGLIFAVITPGVAMNIDEHLCGYDKVLDFFGFGDWHLVSQRELPGPNWKIAYDGYLDFYHLPFLHRGSFGPDMQQQGDLHDVGSAPADDPPRSGVARAARRPRGRVEPRPDLRRRVDDLPPHLHRRRQRRGPGGPALPGHARPAPRGRSSTTTSRPSRPTSSGPRPSIRPTSSRASCATRTTPPACGIQRALASGAKRSVFFGRNEGGGQRFHRTLDRYIARDAAPAQTPSST